MLAKPAGNDLQPLGQGPPPTAGRQGADVEPGDEEAARQLWAHPLSNLPERAPSRPGATEAAAPLERVSPLGDIVLDAATLHIPSMAEPESDVRGAYALPGQYTLACRDLLSASQWPPFLAGTLQPSARRPGRATGMQQCVQAAGSRPSGPVQSRLRS